MQKLQNFALLPSLSPHHLPRALLLWPTFAFLLTHEYFIVVLCLSHANAIERTEAADVACVSACGEIFVFVFFWFFLVYFCCNFGRKWVSLRCITYILVYAFTLYLLQRRLNVLWRIVVSLHVRVCMCVCACVSTCIYFELFIIMMGALIAYKVCIHILLFACMLRWTFMTYLTPIICG